MAVHFHIARFGIHLKVQHAVPPEVHVLQSWAQSRQRMLCAAMCISGRLQLSQSCHWCHLLCFCRCEREQLYKHWLNTLASDWGNDISNLVSQLEVEQVRLTKLYDQASLQVCHPNAAAVAQIALSSMLILDHLMIIRCCLW